MKKKLLYLIFPIIALILEILPYGAVCNFATESNGIIRETFSYFDLVPFGYANFSPFLTAIITCAVLALSVIYLFADKPIMLKVTKALSCAAVVLSLCPLLYGISYYSLVGALITVSLIAELVLLFVTTKKPSAKNPKK